MRAQIAGERIEQVDLLTMSRPISRRQVEVFLFDVEHHHRIFERQQVRDDDRHALARPRRRRQNDKLGAAKKQVLAQKLPYQDAFALGVEFGSEPETAKHLHSRGKPGFTVKCPLLQSEFDDDGEGEKCHHRKAGDQAVDQPLGEPIDTAIDAPIGCPREGADVLEGVGEAQPQKYHPGKGHPA